MSTVESAIALLQQDQSSTDQQRACKLLATLNTPAALRVLIKTLQTEDPHVFEAAVEGLIHVHAQEAPKALIEVLKREDRWGIRHRVATQALGLMGDESAISVLAQLASKHHWHSVREAAAIALGNFPHPEAEHALIALLADDDYAVQCAAATSLGELAKKKEAKKNDTANTDTNARTSTATEALCKALLKPDMWGLLQTAAILALKNTHDPSAIPALLTLLQRTNNPAILIDHTLDALVAIGPIAVGPLLSILSFVNRDTQTAISKSFHQLNEIALAAVFPGILYGKEEELATLHALFKSGDIRCLSTLLARMQQLERSRSAQDEVVQQRISRVLKQVQHIQPPVICTQHLTRFISSYKDKQPQYACRTCGLSYYALHVRKVVLILEKKAPAQDVDTANAFTFNWLKQPILIDFDEVIIGNAPEDEILRFCVMVGNDTDLFRKSKVRCTIKSTSPLSPNVRRILDKTFAVT